ncbi:MAG: sugar isomerase domain-containing protein [Ilumatobacteraceae bacterium]
MPDQYFHRLITLIEHARDTNDTALDRVSAAFADTLASGGLVHLFGSGHSVLPCQEAFPRYGSFIGFNPLTDPRLMWHDVLGTGGVRELLWLERTEHYIDKFLSHEPLNSGDCIIVYSHSGRNAAGIDAALYAKKRGLFVVVVSCGAMLDQAATHSSGKRLPDVADVFIDTMAPPEDAIVPVAGWSRPVSGTSTVLSMILTHELIARTAVNLSARGIELPTFASPTVPGVTLGDTDLVYTQYRERMLAAQQKHLAAFKEEMGA